MLYNYNESEVLFALTMGKAHCSKMHPALDLKSFEIKICPTHPTHKESKECWWARNEIYFIYNYMYAIINMVQPKVYHDFLQAASPE